MGKTAAWFVLAAALAVGQTPAPSDSEHIATFRSEVSLVKVDVQVTTPAGTSIDDLTESDFVLFDEGAPQRVLHFGREREPLSVLLLLDVSGSMTKTLSTLASTCRQALGQLHPGDQVAVMVFSERTQVVQPYTAEFGKVRDQIVDSMYKRVTGEGTMLNEAILSAASYVREHAPEGRRAILVVTDNQSLRFGTSDQEVLRAADAASATINGILVGAPVNYRAARYANPAATQPSLFDFARSTGGETMDAAEITKAFPRIVQRIRTRYTLDYSPTGGDSMAYRKIRVELSPAALARHPSAKIEARTGYYTGR